MRPEIAFEARLSGAERALADAAAKLAEARNLFTTTGLDNAERLATLVREASFLAVEVDSEASSAGAVADDLDYQRAEARFKARHERAA